MPKLAAPSHGVSTAKHERGAAEPVQRSTVDSTTLRTVLDTSPTAAMIVGEGGTIVLTNGKLETLFGYGRSELLGQSVELLVPPDVRKDHPDLREAFFEYPSPRSMGTGRDLYGLAQSGEQIPVEIGLYPMQTEVGLRVLATVVDDGRRFRGDCLVQRFDGGGFRLSA